MLVIGPAGDIPKCADQREEGNLSCAVLLDEQVSGARRACVSRKQRQLRTVMRSMVAAPSNFGILPRPTARALRQPLEGQSECSDQLTCSKLVDTLRVLIVKYATVKEFRHDVRRLLAEVDAAGRFVTIQRGKPVAILGPVAPVDEPRPLLRPCTGAWVEIESALQESEPAYATVGEALDLRAAPDSGMRLAGDVCLGGSRSRQSRWCE